MFVHSSGSTGKPKGIVLSHRNFLAGVRNAYRGGAFQFGESVLALLEARYALRVLWALRDGHAQTFRLLQDSVGGITPNTLNTRIKELREAGLLDHGHDGYCVTPSGVAQAVT